jgi:uncharacterized protein (TIGR03083 family)
MSERKATLKRQLQEARDALLAEVDQVVESDWAKPTPVEGWTVRDQLSHLAYNQPGQPKVIRSILEGKGGTSANFDLNYYNRRGLEKQKDKSIEQLKAELAAGHAEMLRMLDEMSEEELDKRGNHASAGETTVENIVRTVARHDREHTGYIREALKR